VVPDNDWRRRAKYFQEPYLSQGLTLADKLRSVGAKHGRTAGEAAIAWTLRHAAVTAAIVGARRPDQLDGIVGAADMRLTDADMKQIG
jgi:aryl-alcohol dehydrogenase-like predicted oxidoreductase